MLRFMESPSVLRPCIGAMNRGSSRAETERADKSDALQTPRVRPSQWTTRQRLECVRLQRRFAKPAAIRCLRRFMESPLSLLRMHWDHEPVWAIQSAAGPAHSKTWRKCARLSPTR